jgi:hypothetical protein
MRFVGTARDRSSQILHPRAILGSSVGVEIQALQEADPLKPELFS